MVNLQTAALDPNFSDQASLYGPPRPAGQAQQTSVLDMLRQRMAREMEGEELRRVSEFGAGMLASGSPNFFSMLGAGARAAQQGDASRMDRLRQIAETERQQRALENQEAAQRAEAEYRQRRLDVESPLREAQADQARALADYYRQGGRGGGTGTGGQITPARRAQIFQQAQQQALREFPDPQPGMPESETARAERLRRRETRAAELFVGALAAGGQAAPEGAAPNVTAPPAPAARIDARGNPIR